MKKDFETLIEEAIDNVRQDRNQTKNLLKDLIQYIAASETRHKETGITAAKYVETLQRSNEQLVKIAALKRKEETDNTNLSDEDRDEIFKELNEVVK